MAGPEFSSPAKMQPAWHAPGRFSLPKWRKTAIRFRAKEKVFLVVSSINSDESRAAGSNFPARFAPSSSVMEPEALHGTMINLCIQSWPLICRAFEKWRCIVAASGCFRAAFWYLPGQNRHTESRMIIKIRTIDFRNTALTSGQKNHNMIYRSRLYPSMLLGGHQGMNYHMTMADHFSQNPKEMPS